jgi:hypothetical protein
MEPLRLPPPHVQHTSQKAHRDFYIGNQLIKEDNNCHIYSSHKRLSELLSQAISSIARLPGVVNTGAFQFLGECDFAGLGA